MITIDSGPEWFALGLVVVGSALLGAMVGAWIVVLLRELVLRMELHREREDAERARRARMLGLSDTGVRP